jgi:Tetratricopeptide repeat
MCQQALQGKEKTLGADHISTLDTVNDLGIHYQGPGKLAEAEVMYQRVLQGREKVLGLNHWKRQHLLCETTWAKV